jgi:hypothetical protein
MRVGANFSGAEPPIYLVQKSRARVSYADGRLRTTGVGGPSRKRQAAQFSNHPAKTGKYQSP